MTEENKDPNEEGAAGDGGEETLETLKAKAAEAAATLAAKDEEIEKLKASDKSRNFAAMRAMLEAADGKAAVDAEDKRSLEEKVNELQEAYKLERDAMQRKVDEQHKLFLKGAAGGKEDMSERIDAHFKNSLQSMPETTAQEIAQKRSAAVLLAKGPAVVPDLLGGAAFTSGGAGDERGEAIDFTESSEGSQAFSSFFPDSPSLKDKK